MDPFYQELVTTLQNLLPRAVSVSAFIYVFIGSWFFLFLGCLIGLIRLSDNRKRIKELTEKLVESKSSNQKAQDQARSHEIRAIELAALLDNEQKHSKEKLGLLEKARDELSLQFSELAHKIFDEKSLKITELNKEKLENVLDPLKNQLVQFKQEINEIYRLDSHERVSLKKEINQLHALNKQMGEETTALTKALTSDNKAQGNWGELVLERILETTGLRKGFEFETQTGYRTPDNQLRKPDVIVHLPAGKDLIIDAKVSLTSWERYMKRESENEGDQHLLELVSSIRSHAQKLSEKNYPELEGLHSLDFVLMFMPIEAAFAAAVQQDDTLVTDTLAKHVIIVTPTTLLATMRTVENIWQFEQQSKNSLEIARRAGLMYDKFCGFVEDLEKIGRQLSTCQTTYEDALRKLTSGRGNIISQAQQLKELGVQAKKQLSHTTSDSHNDLKN